MKAALFFKLPEDQTEHTWALHAGSLYLVISELDNFLREKIKYEDQKQIDMQEMRDKLWEIVRENDCEHLFG